MFDGPIKEATTIQPNVFIIPESPGLYESNKENLIVILNVFGVLLILYACTFVLGKYIRDNTRHKSDIDITVVKKQI